MRLEAYAKLNLGLNITGRLGNGMHTLDMLMQNISLSDGLAIEKADGISFCCDGMEADETNTAVQAAKAFFEYTHIGGGADISLEKRIPSQAGLGGGSSDAGAVLSALNLLYETKLTTGELVSIGVRVGADVPFFIRGGCMRAQGIGEILEPVENNCDFSYLLVKPEGGVPTGLAYEKYHGLPVESPDIGSIADALAAGDAQAYFRAAGNALMPAGIAICPQVGTILKECRELGADFAMMTGSGSCVFAVFLQEKAREQAFAALAGKYPFCAEAENVDKAYEII